MLVFKKLMKGLLFVGGIIGLFLFLIFWIYVEPTEKLVIDNHQQQEEAEISNDKTISLSTKEIKPLSSSFRSINQFSPTVKPSSLLAVGQEVEGYVTKDGVVVWTNIARMDEGLNTVLTNSQLDQVANIRLTDMINQGYFDHYSPTGQGVAEAAIQAGYQYHIIGENLARGFFTSDQDLVDAWLQSPDHRQNILESRFRHIGVAVGKLPNGEWLAVQIFGSPRPQCYLPNKTLKANIEANKSELEKTANQISLLKQQIENDVLSTVERAQKITDHNQLIIDYNDLLLITEASITEYNNQVNQYNNCIR